MTESHAHQVLKILKANYSIPRWKTETGDSFRTLIVTIISQNTASGNTERAFQNLSDKFKITPEALAKASSYQIERCLKTAGLYRNKAKAIKQVSKIVSEQLGGDLSLITSLPLEEARKKLMQFPGVGPKTADVVLLFSAGKSTMPVDTHVNRVSKRLGLAPKRGTYEEIRSHLEALYHPRDYFAVHVLLIAHGRRYCKARNPRCTSCPLRELCPSKGAV